MFNLSKFLEKSKNQKIINGIISIILIIWIIAKWRYVEMASDIIVIQKYKVLKIISLIYLFQTFKNKVWLSTLLRSIYLVIVIYIIYTYVYAFFDENDYTMQKENGIVIKSLETTIKLTIFLVLIWFTDKMKPKVESNSF